MRGITRAALVKGSDSRGETYFTLYTTRWDL